MGVTRAGVTCPEVARPFATRADREVGSDPPVGVCAGDRGGTLVEFALAAPLLFVVLFSLVDFGWAYNQAQAVRQASRDGARAVVAGSVGTSTCTTSPAATGQLQAAVCLTKARTSLPAANTTVRVAAKTSGTCTNGTAASTSNPCTGPGDPVTVCVQHPLRSVSGVWQWQFNNRYLTSATVMRLEKTLPFALPAGAWSETGGGSWSFCPNPT